MVVMLTLRRMLGVKRIRDASRLREWWIRTELGSTNVKRR